MSLFQSTTRYRVRLAALAVAVAGVLFVLYPAIRPFSDEASLQGTEAFASPAWLVSHVLGMLGFILLALGLAGLRLSLHATAGERPAFGALILAWVGAGLTLPFYGAETFGLHVVGQEAVRQQDAGVLALADDIRSGPGVIMMAVGLVLLAVGAIVAAAAVWRSGALPRWSGVPLAVGIALYLPQFAAPEPVRIAHGLLVTAGCLWVALGMWRQRSE